MRGIDRETGPDDERGGIESLHHRYAAVIYDLCVRMLGDRAEAEDAVQEAFVNAYRFWDSFCYGSSRLPWLYAIGVNTCLKIIRTRRRQGALLQILPSDVGSKGSDPVDGLHARRILDRLVGELDERGQRILAAHHLAGMSQGQIADMLGISRRAVVKRLTALRARVAELLGEGNGHG